MKKYNHKYKLTWTMKKHPKGLSKNRLEDYRHPEVPVGGCDAVLFCSMIYPEDGSFSVYFIGVDGRKNGKQMEDSLEDNEWFKVWSMLANRLAKSETLEPRKKALCDSAFEDIRFKIFGLSKN